MAGGEAASSGHDAVTANDISFSVRRATRADGPAILTCLTEAFEPYRAEYTPGAFDDTVPELAGIEARLASMIALVAVDANNDIIGTVSAAVVNRSEGHLRGMAVRPRWQGTPVADQLMNEALASLQNAGCREVTLDTTRPLQRAVRFYERHGFIHSGVVTDFFEMPLLRFSKELESADRHSPPRRVIILLFDDVEILDFAGPYEVFSLAAAADSSKLCAVETVGPDRSVICNGGLRVETSFRFGDCPTADLLVVPGGPGVRTSNPQQKNVLQFIHSADSLFSLVASVCTGSFLLARAGLLWGRAATTHTQRAAEFRREHPAIQLTGDKIVDTGAVVTSGGISSGIDLSLYILEKWFGRQCRAEVARRLDGPWT